MIPSETTKIQQIDDLDAVRGIGILMVFFFHVTGYFKYDIPFLPPFIKSFITAGYSGVTLLFALSAFLLFQPYSKSLVTGLTPSWKKFYMRRALRILPMYLLMVIISIPVLQNYKYSLMALNIFWGVNGPDLHPFSTAWWAIYTEVQFYVVLPLIGFLLVHNKKLYLIVLSIIYVALYSLIFLIGYLLLINNLFNSVNSEIIGRLILSFLGQGFIFIIGGFTSWFFIYHGESIKSRLLKSPFFTKAGDSVLVVLLLFLGLLLWITDDVGYYKMETHYPFWHIIEAMLWCGFILGLLLLPLKFKKVISNGFFKQIGKISYSIYLLHYPILVYGYLAIQKVSAANHLPVPSKGVLVIIIFIVCIGVSALTYQFIEKPFLEKKQHFY